MKGESGLGKYINIESLQYNYISITGVKVEWSPSVVETIGTT